MAPKSERPPPGAGALSGQYDTSAFAAFIFPAKGDHNATFKQRVHHRVGEHRDFASPPGMIHNAAVDYAVNKESLRPSRLRVAFNEHAQARLEGSMRSSYSSPDLGGLEAQRVAVAEAALKSVAPSQPLALRSMPALDEGTPEVDPMTLMSMSINTRWYPHVSANRGSLKLTGPAALTQSIDPARDKGHTCPFWEAPKHRFAEVKSLPGGQPQIPSRSFRWNSDVAWQDAANHASFKVTQTMPKPMTFARTAPRSSA